MRPRSAQREPGPRTDVADGVEGSTGGAPGPGWASVPVVAGGSRDATEPGVTSDVRPVGPFGAVGWQAATAQARAVMTKAWSQDRRMRRPFAFDMPKRASPAFRRMAALAGALASLAAHGCQAKTEAAAGPPPLVLERTIPLAGVHGRIDHMAIDVTHKRLFVAELGNGSVESIDIATGRSLGRVGGLKEPQGLAHLPARGELAVASGGDGTVRFYRADDLAAAGSLVVGGDADNLRVDPATGDIVVGFGDGALGVIDPVTRSLARRAPLPGHPESFQIEAGRAFVNVPDAGAIVTVDLANGRELARWRNAAGRFNFPLALEPGGAGLASVYRLPARVAFIDRRSGQVIQALDTCGDSDDAFFDAKRRRLYVVCGGGAVDVFQQQGAGGYARLARVPTRGGARTGWYSPDLDRLFVAARAEGGQGAALLVLRPTP